MASQPPYDMGGVATFDGGRCNLEALTQAQLALSQSPYEMGGVATFDAGVAGKCFAF